MYLIKCDPFQHMARAAEDVKFEHSSSDNCFQNPNVAFIPIRILRTTSATPTVGTISEVS